MPAGGVRTGENAQIDGIPNQMNRPFLLTMGGPRNPTRDGMNIMKASGRGTKGQVGDCGAQGGNEGRGEEHKGRPWGRGTKGGRGGRAWRTILDDIDVCDL